MGENGISCLYGSLLASSCVYTCTCILDNAFSSSPSRFSNSHIRLCGHLINKRADYILIPPCRIRALCGLSIPLVAIYLLSILLKKQPCKI